MSNAIYGKTYAILFNLDNDEQMIQTDFFTSS